MRGEDDEGLNDGEAGGIIPAGAGRSFELGDGAAEDGDHPRGCGEKRGEDGRAGPGGGSSPRVRGEARRAGRVRRNRGIIPAGAGRSLTF